MITSNNFIHQVSQPISHNKTTTTDYTLHNQDLAAQENKAKEALMKLQEIQNTKLNDEDANQIAAWTNSKPNIQSHNLNLKYNQKYTIFPYKTNKNKTLNSRTIDLFSLNHQQYYHQTSRNISQLKFLLETLKSPMQSNQQDKKSNFINCRSYSRDKLKNQSKNKNIKSKQYEKYQIKKDQFMVNEDWRNFQEIKFNSRESIKNKVEKRIFSSKLSRNKNYSYKNEFQNIIPQYTPHNFIKSKMNYVCQKIKSKNPSANQMNLAQEKKILSQLIKQSNKDTLGYHSIKPSTPQRKYSEKFTLTNLLQ